MASEGEYSVSLRAASGPMDNPGDSPNVQEPLPGLDEGAATPRNGFFKRPSKVGALLAAGTILLTAAIVAVIALAATGVIGSASDSNTSSPNAIQARSQGTLTGASPIPATAEPTGDQIPRRQIAAQAVGLSMAYLEAQRAGPKPADAASAMPQVHICHHLLPHTLCARAMLST